LSFCVSFLKQGYSAADPDLLVVDPGSGARVRDTHGIVVSIGNGRMVGRWDDKAERITTFVSGCLTGVPDPLRPGTGVTAARALAALYIKHATDAFALIDGAYCGAIIDWQRRAIVMVRDKLGIGRAYLSRDGEVITFSDSLSHLLSAEQKSVKLDVDSMYAFLMIGWIPTPHSMARGVEKLAPGTYLESVNGALTQATYYDVPHSPSGVSYRPAAELRHEVADQLDRSVERGLSLGGRWGSFLSGGVDSSSVVSSLARSQSTSFPTYFGGFAPELNRFLPNPEEPALSKLVAGRFGTQHRMLWLGPEAVETTPEIIGALEEPVCDGGCIVLAAVMRAAREETDGLMTGIGGDFLFTGERRHMVLSLLRFMRPVPAQIWNGVRWLSGTQPLARNARISQMHFDLTRLLAIRELSIEDMYAGFFLQANAHELQSLFRPEVRGEITRDPLQEVNELFRHASELDPLSRFLYLDLKANLPDHCVREAETLGRHFGLTIYSPFLDAEFVDFAMSVPSVDKVSGLTLKVPLKRAMRGRVPDDVLDRKKGGLGSPIRWWVTRPDGYVADVLSRENIDRRGLFASDVIEQFRRATAEGVRDYTKLLWSLFTLELWMERYVG
jgi:asparagine synthase (glutamine-hydrolysing)